MLNAWFHIQALALGLTLLGEMVATAGAAIIDDFDTPAQHDSPAMINEYVLTQDVGDFKALRRVRSASIVAEPTGTISIGHSRFESDLGATNASSSSAQVAVQSEYVFALNLVDGVQDLSEGRTNNAFLFDFDHFAAAVTPTFFRMFSREDSVVWESRVELPFQESPFRLVVPFDSFVSRGGGAPGNPRFEKVASIDWEVMFRHDLPTDLSASLSLNRISVGRVPESSTLVLLAAAVVGAVTRCGVRSLLREKGRGDERSKHAWRIVG